MPTPTQLLELKIRRREDALRAREAELEELKESLQKLQSARRGIRGAIEDALSDAPTTTITPTDVLELAVEGNTDANPFAANGSITAEEAVKLALISMRNDLGSKGLVKMIIQTAAKVSELDGEGLIKAMLETVRTSDLTTSGVVRAALQASRNSNHIFAADIITPAVETAMERGIEAPVIVKEAFVSAARGHPSLVRTSVLSVLGCAMGMGMNHRDIKSIIKAFSKEIKLDEVTEVRQSITANVAVPSKDAPFLSPSQPQNVNQMQSQEPKKPEAPQVQKSQPGMNQGDYGEGVDSAVVEAMVECALQSIDSGGPGMPACGNVMEMMAAWPQEYGVATGVIDGIRKERARAAVRAGEPNEFYDDDQPPDRPSKRLKLSTSRYDGQSKRQ